jgi:hypothetical protein
MLVSHKIQAVLLTINIVHVLIYNITRGRRGRDRMVVWFTTSYAISAYYHLNPLTPALTLIFQAKCQQSWKMHLSHHYSRREIVVNHQTTDQYH